MNINILDLLSGRKDYIELDEIFEIDKEKLVNKDLVDIKNVRVSGVIKRISEELFHINLDIEGNMILNDSITLEEIDYPFYIELDESIEESVENLRKTSNTLDIFNIIWENIVLEIPTRIVKSEKAIELKGDGWKIETESEELK